MGAMSELDAAITEAKDLCDYDSLACERDHLRTALIGVEANFELVMINSVMIGKPMPVEVLRDWLEQGLAAVRKVLKETEPRNKPERDAESKPDTTQG